MTASALAVVGVLAGGAALIGCSGPQPEHEQAALDRALRDLAAAQAGLEAMRRGVAVHEVPPRPIPSPGARASGWRSPRAAGDLAGLTGGELRTVIGDPDLVRDEGEAQAWLYRGPSCLLDVFLEGEGEPRVVLATARASGLDRLPEEACLRALSRARARQW
jgi:hypothetical protein